MKATGAARKQHPATKVGSTIALDGLPQVDIDLHNVPDGTHNGLPEIITVREMSVKMGAVGLQYWWTGTVVPAVRRSANEPQHA
jgi:hypothetical protein